MKSMKSAVLGMVYLGAAMSMLNEPSYSRSSGGGYSVKRSTPLNKKQAKARRKNKQAKKTRKNNR